MTEFRAASHVAFRTSSMAARRRFLRQTGMLLIGAGLSGGVMTRAFADTDPDLEARTNKQWTRLQRGLSQGQMAGCRTAAERVMPRLDTLLKGSQAERQLVQAIVNELKQVGVLPSRAPARAAGCPQIGESAGAVQSADAKSFEAAVGVAAEGAGVPITGPIIAAVLAVVAAVIVIIGTLIGKAVGETATEGGDKETEKSAQLKKVRRRAVAATESEDDCDLFGRKP